MEYSNSLIPSISTHDGIIFQQFPRNVGIPGGRFVGIFRQNIPSISTVSEYSINDSIRKERVNIQLDDLRRAAAGPRGRNLKFLCTLYFVLCTACRGCVEGPASTWRLAKSRGRAPPEEPYFYFLLCTLHRLQMEYSNIYSIRKASAILLESWWNIPTCVENDRITRLYSNNDSNNYSNKTTWFQHGFFNTVFLIRTLNKMIDNYLRLPNSSLVSNKPWNHC